MKVLPLVVSEDAMGFRFYEGEKIVGYISLRQLDRRCKTCEDEDCDWCHREEFADYIYYEISTTYPLEGFSEAGFYTNIDNKYHEYYLKIFTDSTEAAKTFMEESQKLMKS